MVINQVPDNVTLALFIENYEPTGVPVGFVRSIQGTVFYIFCGAVVLLKNALYEIDKGLQVRMCFILICKVFFVM
ncbi:MAG: hypothetical protein ABIX01_01050 [Chitinophagaceae bacterium]